MNKRLLAKWGLSLVLTALGLALPALIFSGNTMTFEMQYGLTAISEVLMIGLPALIFLTDLGANRGALSGAFSRQSAERVGYAMLAAVGFTMVGVLVTVLWVSVLSLFGFSPLQPMLENPDTAGRLGLAVLLVAAVPALCEEMLFRGVLLRYAARKWGEERAIWITAALFAAAHFSVAGFPALLMIGMLLARLAFKGRGLTLPVVFHAMYNLSAIVINRYGATPGLFTMLLSAMAFRWAIRRLLRDQEA